MNDLQIERTNPSDEISSNNQSLAIQNTEVNDYDIDSFLEKRAEFITKVKKIMVEGKDYHVIQGKKSLAKGGAEKIASIFQWQASFTKDEDVSGAFKIEGLIAFKCILAKHGTFVGEGRGAATLQRNGSDPNKTIKMAQKSAFIDAVLRASGLSDFFTQDLEDMNHVDILNPERSEPKATEKQVGFIKGLLKKKGQADIPSEELSQLSITEAKAKIDTLLSLPDEEAIPTIQIETPQESQDIASNSESDLFQLTGQKLYTKLLEYVNGAKTLKELDAVAENFKFVKKQLTASQYVLLRNAGQQKRQDLDPIQIDK